MQRKHGLLTVVGGAAGAPLFQQRNSPYPRLTLSIQILLHRNTNLDLHACGKKNSYAMAHASKYSLSKNFVYPSMEGGQLNSAFLRLYLKTILLTNTQVLGCH